MSDPTPSPSTEERPQPDEVVQAVDAWLGSARFVWQQGHVIHVTICPGDATRYVITFTPEGAHETTTTDAYRLNGPVAALSSPRQAVWQFAPDGDPWPSYVEEKIGTDNAYTVAAVGIVWALLVGNDPASVAARYSDERFDRVFREWDLARFALTPADRVGA